MLNIIEEFEEVESPPTILLVEFGNAAALVEMSEDEVIESIFDWREQEKRDHFCFFFNQVLCGLGLVYVSFESSDGSLCRSPTNVILGSGRCTTVRKTKRNPFMSCPSSQKV